MEAAPILSDFQGFGFSKRMLRSEAVPMHTRFLLPLSLSLCRARCSVAEVLEVHALAAMSNP